MLNCYVCDIKSVGPHFRFPRGEKRNKWMQLLGLKSPPEQSARICSLHFSPSDFYHDGNRMQLRDIAHPLPQVCLFCQFFYQFTGKAKTEVQTKDFANRYILDIIYSTTLETLNIITYTS